MILVSLSKISITYGGNLVLDQVDLEVQKGDRIGVVGENGSGKSTLFRLIAGEETPTEGTVARSQGLQIGFLHQEADPADAGKTVYDAVVQATPELAALARELHELEQRMGSPEAVESAVGFDKLIEAYGAAQARFELLGGYELEFRVRSILTGLGFDSGRQGQLVGTLSGGEKKIVNLARLLLQSPELLLLDEPDNHLDLDAKAWLEEYVRSYPGTVMIISHDRHLLDQIVKRIHQIEDGELSVYHGNYTQYVTERQHRLMNQQQLYELQQREIKRLEAALRQLKEWARMQVKFAPRAESMAKRVERAKKEAAARPVLSRKRISVNLDAQRSGKRVLALRGVSKTLGGRVLFRPFDLDIAYGEHIGVIGPNGSGKTTLVRIILDTIRPDSGTVKHGASVVLGYYSQEQETLPFDKTPLEFVRSLRPMTEDQAFGALRRVLFSNEEIVTPIRLLSGGQKSRLQIMRLMLTEANFLLLDEPTNNLDIPSAEILEGELDEFEGTILTVSHDRYFLDKICQRLIVFEDNGLVRVCPGNYSDYYSRRAAI